MDRQSAAKKETTILVGGGQGSGDEVRRLLAFGRRVIAADGGAALALAAGVMPDLVVGDFDSLSSDVAAEIPADRLVSRPDQGATDFQKALAEAGQAPVLAAGFLGGRLDHQFAAFSALLGRRSPTVLVGGGEIVTLCPGKLALRLPIGTPLALYPLLSMRVQTSGLVWNVDGMLSPDGLISTSNRTAAAEITLSAEAAGVLLILPEAALELLYDALLVLRGSEATT
ncbi:MAG: thiamine diphosphokinase [Pseudomonadota bacterium]